LQREIEMKKDFTQIPNGIIRDVSLSNCLFRTYVALRAYAYGENKSFPAQQTVADSLGKRRETINRHVSELERKGYIKKRRRGYSLSNEYDFCDEIVSIENKGNDKNITPEVRFSLHPLLEITHTNNTNKKTKKNIEILEKKLYELGLKKKSRK